MTAPPSRGRKSTPPRLRNRARRRRRRRARQSNCALSGSALSSAPVCPRALPCPSRLMRWLAESAGKLISLFKSWPPEAGLRALGQTADLVLFVARSRVNKFAQAGPICVRVGAAGASWRRRAQAAQSPRAPARWRYLSGRAADRRRPRKLARSWQRFIRNAQVGGAAPQQPAHLQSEARQGPSKRSQAARANK